MEEFTPKVIVERSPNSAYGIMLVELTRCPICSKWIVERIKNRYYSPFQFS